MPSTSRSLRCLGCATSLPLITTAWACPRCGGLLDPTPPAPADVRAAAEQGRQAGGLWRFRPVLPLPPDAPPATLGEGGTPLVPLEATRARLGLGPLWAKLESCNPTGSFKDRGASTMISMLRLAGAHEVVEDSSGNAGAAIAAYGARAGLRCTIFVPASAPAAKRDQIAVYGAEVVVVEGDRAAVAEAARARCRGQEAVYASHVWSPWFIEGTRTIAYELLADLPAPLAHLVMPVGNGSLLLGAARGFAELRAAGLVERPPRLYAVQAAACPPLALAFARGSAEPAEVTGAPTRAGGIAVARPARGGQVLAALRASGGQALSVEEAAILAWQRRLAREEGILVEPTAAAAFAGLERLAAAGAFADGGAIVVAVTGLGLKDPEALSASC